MRPRTLALVALAGATSGCVNGFVCSRHGGLRWRELGTEHFVLRTNLDSDRARALALELEQLRDAVAHGLLESSPPAGARVQVVISSLPRQFLRFSPAGAAGLFTESIWGEPTIVLPGELAKAQRTVIAHELAHMLTATDGARQPLWFREGVACYVETVRFHGPEANVRLGDVAHQRALAINLLRGSMRGVLTERGRLTVGQYGLAWLLVHFLMNERSEGLGALEERFARGEDPQAAWRAVFPEWDSEAPDGPGRLEDALFQYSLGGARAQVFPHPRLVSIPPPAERLMSSAEVHDMRLALPSPNQGRGVPGAELLAEAREALEEDSGSPTAVALLSAEPGADRRALADRATRGRPRDARNWVLLASALPADEPAAREAALRRALAADPESPVALHALARFLVDQRRASEALAPARRAVAIAPWSPSALDGAAAVLDALGDCKGALALEERALDNLHEGGSEEARTRFAERRDRLRAACGGERALPAPR